MKVRAREEMMLRSSVTLTVLSLLSVFVYAQTPSNAGKERVFMSDSQSWETSGSAGGQGGKGALHRDNKVAVFNSDGDSIASHSTRSLGNAVKDACDPIAK